MSFITKLAALFHGLPLWLQAIAWASLYGTILIAGLMVLNPVLRVPARWRFVLWLVVLVRFVPLPLPESRVSLFNWLPHQSERAEVVVAATVDNTITPIARVRPKHALPEVEDVDPTPAVAIHTPMISVQPDVIVGRTVVDAPVAADSGWKWPLVIQWIYLAGVGVVLARLALAMVSLRRMIGRAEVIIDSRALRILQNVEQFMGVKRMLPLLAVEGLSSPALVGMIRPRLLMPRGLIEKLSEEELRQVFLHEAAHLRRRDIAVNYVLALLGAMHWFNPVLWLAMPRVRAERELACDELVLRITGDRASYGNTLLRLLETTTPARGRGRGAGRVPRSWWGLWRIVLFSRGESK